MVHTLYSMLPDPTTVYALEPEELAGVLMAHIGSLPPNEIDHLNRFNFFELSSMSDHVGPFRDYPRNAREGVANAFLEAWKWLESEGLLVPKLGDSSGNSFRLSRRAEKMTTRADVDAYRHQNVLPREQLHPRIAQKVWATFLRGDYDTAVFNRSRKWKLRCVMPPGCEPRTWAQT
jgi:hypothetical protein